jgi:hypothetical protein
LAFAAKARVESETLIKMGSLELGISSCARVLAVAAKHNKSAIEQKLKHFRPKILRLGLSFVSILNSLISSGAKRVV